MTEPTVCEHGIDQLKNNQSQLCASMELIAECDFPFEWTNLLPDMRNSLQTNPHQKAVIFEALEPVFRTFEEQERSNDVLRGIKYCVEDFSKTHLEAFKQSCQRLQGANSIIFSIFLRLYQDQDLELDHQHFKKINIYLLQMK